MANALVQYNLSLIVEGETWKSTDDALELSPLYLKDSIFIDKFKNRILKTVVDFESKALISK